VCNDPTMARAALAYIEAKNIPRNTRLPRMRARREWTRDELTSNGCWQLAHETVTRLVGEP